MKKIFFLLIGLSFMAKSLGQIVYSNQAPKITSACLSSNCDCINGGTSNVFYDLDINKDGVVDCRITQFFRCIPESDYFEGINGTEYVASANAEVKILLSDDTISDNLYYLTANKKINNTWYQGVNVKYVGLKIKNDSTYFYAWVRVKTTMPGTSSKTMEIMDYAYNSVPKEPIRAGEGLNIANKITNLSISDTDTNCAVEDIKVNFELAPFEKRIQEYRVYVVEDTSKFIFTNSSLKLLDTTKYFNIPPSNSNVSTQIKPNIKTVDNNLVICSMPISVVVAMIPIEGFDTIISTKSNLITLTNPAPVVTGLATSTSYISNKIYSLKINFTKALNDYRLKEYMLLFVKESDASNMTIAKLNVLPSFNYKLLARGQNYSLNFSSDTIYDYLGNPILLNTNYKTYVISVKDDVLSNVTTIVGSANWKLSHALIDYDAINVKDVGNNLNASDIQISLTSSKTEEAISEYRVFIVPDTSKSMFNRDKADLTRYFVSISPNGQNQSIILSDTIKDVNGNAISQDQIYHAFVLFKTNGNALNDVFSTFSQYFKLSNPNLIFIADTSNLLITTQTISKSGNGTIHLDIDNDGVLDMSFTIYNQIVSKTYFHYSNVINTNFEILVNGSNKPYAFDSLDMILDASFWVKGEVVLWRSHYVFTSFHPSGTSSGYYSENIQNWTSAIKYLYFRYLDKNNKLVYGWVNFKTNSESNTILGYGIYKNASIIPLDDDNDGIANSIDQCPNTLTGTIVNQNGCPLDPVDLDDDNDGIVNSIDQCPNTIAGSIVNEDGCSLSIAEIDDDFDGVQNDADQCPNTQIGSEVNDFGCSQNQLDDDKDGVVNDSDHCSKTVFGDAVNDFGCSRNQLEDDDYDGVLNYLDSCPDTRKNVFYVDDNGCELLGLNEQEQTQIQLYPNPVANYVLVPLSTNKDVLELYNSVGTKQVLNITEQNGELNIDTSALEQGLYLLKVNGRVYRFVKE